MPANRAKPLPLERNLPFHELQAEPGPERSPEVKRGIERCFDIPFVADLALHEKQIQQNYRPLIAVHKWFARRPGTLFRALLVAEFVGGSLRENYYRAHSLRSIHVADPFMGGGTPLLEANRLGCNVLGLDINPMAYWIVSREIEHLDIEAYQQAAFTIGSQLEKQVGHLYRTRCILCGRQDAHVKYFIWVKVQTCSGCGQEFDLFPGYVLAENRRHPKNVIICAACGTLNEVTDKSHPGTCSECQSPLAVKGPASRSHCKCPHCGQDNIYPNAGSGPPKHRMVAIEYHCPHCKPHHAGRFFKSPDRQDIEKYQEAVETLGGLNPDFIPDDQIPRGDETDRLHRWGYSAYREMFNPRQLLGLELIARAITVFEEERVRNALATNLSDLLRYQNMLCRYDSGALKSLDIFSVHGFPVGLIQCESNILGIVNPATGANIGSGGWANIVEKYSKAKQYCSRPFEIMHQGGRKKQVFVDGEWIGDRPNGNGDPRVVELRCESATEVDLPAGSLDAVLTDPPYFANVQYAELMDFCYVWLRRLISGNDPAFARPTTRHEDELTGNITMDRGPEHFTAGLSQVFTRMAKALKPGGPFAFTYHHNRIEAYYPIAIALLDAKLVCTASIPCPAEMEASIHINGTSSSVIDTVFVCRTTGTVKKRLLVRTPEEVASLIAKDMQQLKAGGIRITMGDVRCMIHGHLIRLVVWNLRQTWDASIPWDGKVNLVAKVVESTGPIEKIETYLNDNIPEKHEHVDIRLRETSASYGEAEDEIPF